MGSAAEKGLGASVTISGTEIEEVTDLGEYGATRADLDVTSHDSSGNAEEFIAGLINGGEVPVTCNLTNGTGQQAAITNFGAGTIVPFIITLPNTAASTFVFVGYVKSYRIKADLKGTIKLSLVIKVTRAPTYTV